MAKSLNVLLVQIRAVLAAAGALGAVSLLYDWSSPAIIWLVDNWSTLSGFLFSWVPLNSTPEGRAVAIMLLLFSGGAYWGGLNSEMNQQKMMYAAFFPLLATSLLLTSLNFQGQIGFFEAIWLIFAGFVALWSVGYSPVYTFSVGFWIGVAFVFDRIARIFSA